MFFSRLPRNYYPEHNRGAQELSLEPQRCVLLKDWTFYLWVEMQFLFPFSSWPAQFLISSKSFSCEGSCTSERDSKKKLRTLAAVRGETCLGNLREEGKDNSEGVFELITPTIEVLFLNRLWVLIFFFGWGNFLRRMGVSFIFICFLSEQWCPPSPFSWTMGIWYNSWCFVRTIKLAHLSWRAHLCQGCLHTCSRA